MTPPRDVKAGDYPVLVKVASEGATAELRVTLQVSGQGRIALSTKDGRLSGEAEVGKASTYTLVRQQRRHRADRGSRDVGHGADQLEGRVQPQDHPEPRAQREEGRAVVVTPADKAIAGDYVASFRANGRGESASADFRITVTTSTLWGIVGVGIIAVALLVLLGAVARFGRR